MRIDNRQESTTVLPTRFAKSSDNNARLLESLLDAGVWTYDFNSRDVTWSAGLYKLIGLDPATVSASVELYESLVHPEDRLTHHQIVEKAAAGEMSKRRFRIIRPDGRLLWVESRTQRVFDRSGAMVMLCGVIQEASATEKLRSENTRLDAINKSLVEIAGGEFWRTDPDGRLLDVSGWQHFTGQSADQLVDLDRLSAVHPDDRDTYRKAWARGIAARSKIEFSARVLRHDGVYQKFLSRIVPIFDARGNVKEWHGLSWLIDDTSTLETAPVSLKSGHFRAARALLNLSGQELADLSDVSFSTVRRLEADVTSVKPESVERVKKAMQLRGIRFGHSAEGLVTVSLTSAG